MKVKKVSSDRAPGVKHNPVHRRGYRCLCCAVCCREMIVPVNVADVRRLAVASGLPPGKIVGFYGSRSIEYDDASPLWIQTRRGPKVMALKRIGNKCRFLSADGRCRVYRQRPSTCGTFPYEIRFQGPTGRPRVERTDWTACPAEPKTVTDRDHVFKARRRELKDDKAFLRLIRSWERSGTGHVADLLAFLFAD